MSGSTRLILESSLKVYMVLELGSGDHLAIKPGYNPPSAINTVIFFSIKKTEHPIHFSFDS